MQAQTTFVKTLSRKNGFPAYFADNHIFVFLDIAEGELPDSAQEVARKLAEYVTSYQAHNLSQVEQAVFEALRTLNLPVEIALALMVRENNLTYLKTSGSGVVLINRKNTVAQIIYGNQGASGRIQSGDKLIFTSERTRDHISLNGFKKETPALQQHLTGEGQGAIIVSFHPEAEYAVPLSKPKTNSPLLQNIFHAFEELRNHPHKKNPVTLVVVGLIAVIFIWSVVLGYKRRAEAKVVKRIQTSREVITQKLNQAEEVAFLNLSRSQALIAEARSEVETLRTEVGPKHAEINELVSLINQKEGKVMRKEEKQAQEFYDLTLDTSHAQGVKMGISDDTAAILDTVNEKLYLLSLTKRSLDKKNFSQLKKASLVNVSRDIGLFFVPTEGMYTVSGASVKKTIERNSDWGSITDFTLYNDNIYLLDPVKSEIYKYLATDSGYASKSAYFKDPSISITGANSLSIDSSVYVSYSDHIAKFTAGLHDEFKTDFPDGNVKIRKVMTAKDMEKVYAWDSEHACIYVMGKNGAYDQQIRSSVLGKADDVVVYSNKAYILVKEKIYTIDL